MTESVIGDIFSNALYIVLSIVMIIIVPSLIIGLMVSTFQAATQINEQTLSFLPRLIVTLLAIIAFGPWAVSAVLDFTRDIYLNIPFLIGWCVFELDALEVSHWVSRYVYPFARISGLLMVMPLIGTRMISQRIRLILAVMITLVVVPLLPPVPQVNVLSLGSFIIILQQLLIGIVLGFVVELLMQVFVIAGQLIAMQTGLGIATTVDPSQGASVVVISQWFLFMVSLVFLALNGHLVLIEVLIDSFRTLPIGYSSFSSAQFSLLVHWSGWMLAAAVVISLPAMTALLIVNLAFGVMTRSAPQLNIFALGFPVTMIVGIFIMWLNIDAMAMGFHGYMENLFEFLKKLISL